MTDLQNTSGEEESFAALFEESLKREEIKEGAIVRGRVIQLTKDYVVIDIGYKSEGQVPIEEFTGADGNVTVKEGDDVEVFLESRENDNGLCVLSKEKADRLKVWDEISAACERDELIEGVISQRVKGGLSVDIAAASRRSCPARRSTCARCATSTRSSARTSSSRSSSSTRSAATSFSRAACSSRRSAPSSRSQTLEKLKEGQIVEGIVKNLTEYGAFIDLGGIDGLLHITDMSWGRVNHPSELFQVGDHVRVKVLKFNSETERVSLGLKQITEDPWTSAQERYTPGTVVKGKVV